MKLPLPRRLTLAIAGLLVVVLLVAGLIQGFGPAALTSPERWRTEATLAVALLTVGMLAADVFLPVPSSLVLIANGALFGPLVGTSLSVVGLLAGATVGWWLGRRGTARAQALLGEHDHRALRDALQRHGGWVVAGTRPIPVVAEVATIAAGMGDMPLTRFLPAAAVGTVAFSLPLGLLGAGVLDGSSGLLTLTGAAAAGLVAWAHGRRRHGRATIVG